MLSIDEININDVTYMATQYNDLAHSTDGAILNALSDEIFGNMYDDELLNLYFEYLSENNLDEYYTLDNDTLDLFLSDKEPSEIVRMTASGNFSFVDDFFQIDDYENLQSFSEYQIINEASTDSDFKQWTVDNRSDYTMEWLEEVRPIYIDLLKKGY